MKQVQLLGLTSFRFLFIFNICYSFNVMKNKDIKILFVDIDWTILDHKNKRFDMKSIKGLKKAQKRGIKVFLCTARPYHSVEQTGLFKIFKPDGAVSGAMVCVEGKTIYKNIIPHNILYPIAESTIKHGLTMECTLENGRFLIAPKDDYVDACFSIFFEEMPEVGDYHNQEVVSILLFCPKDKEKQLKKEMPDGVKWFRFHDSGVDVCYKTHQKSDGVVMALNHLGLLKEQSMSFGDDFSDISMFNATGIGVALNNGKEEAKKAANYVTKEVWKHGVYHALKTYKII